MSILFNLFSSLDEVADYLSCIAPSDPVPALLAATGANPMPGATPMPGANLDTHADPYWRRGFFMALQAAPFYCPADHPLVALSEWLFDVGWAPLWQNSPPSKDGLLLSAGLGMAGGDCDEFNGDALEKAEAGAAVVWRYFLSMAR